MQQILPGIYTWSWYSEEKGYNFNSYAIPTDDGLVVIDPVHISEENLKELKILGTPEHILLTNKDHERISAMFKQLFNSIIYIHEHDANDLKEFPEGLFTEEAILPGGIQPILIEHNKSPGETAFYIPDKKLLIIGDALIGYPQGGFSLLPAIKYLDPEKTQSSLTKLLDYPYDTILVGDGYSVLHQPKEALQRFLERKDIHLSFPVSKA